VGLFPRMCEAALLAGFIGHTLHWYTLFFPVVSNPFLSALLLFAALSKLSLKRQPCWLEEGACCGVAARDWACVLHC